jgi:peptidoglycan/LPS O-acetylase OafA/YrhL
MISHVEQTERLSAVQDRPREKVAGTGTGSHIPALNGVRGLAILVVVLSHGDETGPLRGAVSAPLLRLAEAGWWGVDLFFVLSGFLITGILYYTREHPHYFRNFHARRAVRIFPLYYAVHTAVFLVAPGFGVMRGVSDAAGRDQAWFWLYGVNFLIAYRDSMFPLGTSGLWPSRSTSISPGRV